MSDRAEDRAPRLGSKPTEVPDAVRERVLEHPTREAIVDLLEARPGMNKNQLCETLDLHSNLLNFHLRKLQDINAVATRPSAQDREILCFLREDLGLWENDSTRILFGRSPVRHVGLFLADNPGASTREVADALRMSPVTVRHHLRTLLDFDLIQRFRAGRVFVYQPDEELEAWVADVGQGFERPWLDGSSGSRE